MSFETVFYSICRQIGVGEPSYCTGTAEGAAGRYRSRSEGGVGRTYPQLPARGGVSPQRSAEPEVSIKICCMCNLWWHYLKCKDNSSKYNKVRAVRWCTTYRSLLGILIPFLASASVSVPVETLKVITVMVSGTDECPHITWGHFYQFVQEMNEGKALQQFFEWWNYIHCFI